MDVKNSPIAAKFEKYENKKVTSFADHIRIYMSVYTSVPVYIQRERENESTHFRRVRVTEIKRQKCDYDRIRKENLTQIHQVHATFKTFSQNR